MEPKKIDIDLSAFKSDTSDVYTGRPQGLLVRKDLKLDKIDKDDTEVYLIIPKETTSFNPSFYLGLLFDSLKNLGIDRFTKKYHFKYATEDEQMSETLQKNISDAWRNALNSFNKNYGFESFIKNNSSQ